MQDFLVGVPCCNEPPEVLTETFRAILASTRRPTRVLIIDNGDAEISGDTLTKLGFLRADVVRPQQNLGCAGAWNLIHRLAHPLPAIVLNADCAVTEETFAQMLAAPAPAVVLAYGFGCFRIDAEIRRLVGDFDEAFYPVYGEDHDYRRRLRLAGVAVLEWSTQAVAVVRPGREQAASGIAHGKHDPDGYQGWRGDDLARFHARVEANRAYYRTKWGGGPDQETYRVPFGRLAPVPLDSDGPATPPTAASEEAPPAAPRAPSTSRILPVYETHRCARPLGMAMNQNRLAVPTWSYAMEIHPPTRIVEIGTYNGGFTIALGVHAHRIGARVVTYDVTKAPDEDFAGLAAFLGIEFRTRSVWDAQAEIFALIASPGVTYVLCDGGDKRRELATFAAACKPGDVIAAHDYHVADSQNAWWGWSEIDATDGAAVAAAHDLAPWLQDHFDTAAWLTYRKR